MNLNHLLQTPDKAPYNVNMRKMRTPNYTQEEKDILHKIIHKYRDVLDLRRTDAATNEQKQLTWERIEVEFNSQCPEVRHRTLDSLRKYYHNKKKVIQQSLFESVFPKIENIEDAEDFDNDTSHSATDNNEENLSNFVDNSYFNQDMASADSDQKCLSPAAPTNGLPNGDVDAGIAMQASAAVQTEYSAQYKQLLDRRLLIAELEIENLRFTQAWKQEQREMERQKFQIDMKIKLEQLEQVRRGNKPSSL